MLCLSLKIVIYKDVMDSWYIYQIVVSHHCIARKNTMQLLSCKHAQKEISGALRESDESKVNRIVACHHRTPLVRWLLYKYKCLWGVKGKCLGSSFQEGASHTYTFRLGQSRISILYPKKRLRLRERRALVLRGELLTL